MVAKKVECCVFIEKIVRSNSFRLIVVLRVALLKMSCCFMGKQKTGRNPFFVCVAIVILREHKSRFLFVQIYNI